MAKNNELSIKGRLLLNKLNTCVGVVTNLDTDEKKRKKSLDTIFATYRMTIKPFLDDEEKEYQDKVYGGINAKQDKINSLIEEKVTVEGILFEVNPMMEHLKEMVTTCKTNMDKINTLWGVK